MKELSEYRNNPRFELLKVKALAHWQRHRPKLTRQLKRQGNLDETLDGLLLQALLEYEQLREQGLHADQIREMSRSFFNRSASTKVNHLGAD